MARLIDPKTFRLELDKLDCIDKFGYVILPITKLNIALERSIVDAVPVVRKPVKGYEGYYEVDSLGRVYGLDRVIFVDDNGRKYQKPISAKKLSQTIKSNGYKFVTLTKDGVSKAFYVHRIVAESFIPNPDNLPTSKQRRRRQRLDRNLANTKQRNNRLFKRESRI